MPKARVGFRELDRCIEFSRPRGCNQLYRTFDHFRSLGVPQDDDLAVIQRRAQFDERAMRTYDDGLRLLVEGGLIA